MKIITAIGYALTALVFGAAGCAASQREADSPEKFALPKAVPVTAVAKAEVAPDPEPAKTVAAPQGKDTFEVVTGTDIGDTYRLFFLVDDGNAWAKVTSVPAPLVNIGAQSVIRRNDLSTVLYLNTVASEEGGLAATAKKLAAQLPNESPVTEAKEFAGVTFSFVAPGKNGKERPGTVYVLDAGLFNKYVVIVGMVNEPKSSMDAMSAELAAKLVAMTLQVR